MFFGLDLSHHQRSASVPWDELARVAKFAIVRLTYGTTRDREAAEHIRRARAVGLVVGAYHFFRPDQGTQEQLDAFRAAGTAADYGHHNDIVPALDFEDDTAKRPITPADSPHAETLAHGLFMAFGVMPLVYITQRDWGRVGKPAWLLTHRLWVAHYAKPSRTEPATPDGRPWTMWQHRVGPIDPTGPSGYYEPALYDQNRARELPLLSTQVIKPNGVVSANGVADVDEDDATERLRAEAFAARMLAHETDLLGLRDEAHREMATDPNDAEDEDTVPDLPSNRA